MVQSKADRERQKLITDKCQALIEVLLKDEDNKYCVDCDAKGPRWASWNLGIFLCIRCAGIHRNLGVHISRVKSVNLDSWTPEHVAYVQRMGNSRARAIYEANVPDDFRRPQTDTALESFIRAKYEHKKYIAHNYVDPGPPEPAFNAEDELRKMKDQKKSKLGVTKGNVSVSNTFASSLSSPPACARTSRTAASHSVNSDFLSAIQTKTAVTTKQPELILDQNVVSALSAGNNNDQTKAATTVPTNKSALDDLLDLDFGAGSGGLGGVDKFATGMGLGGQFASEFFSQPTVPDPQGASNSLFGTNLNPVNPPTSTLSQKPSQQPPKFNLIDF